MLGIFMYPSKFNPSKLIQLLAVISLTTVLSACGDKPSDKEQASQVETETSVEVKPEDLNIAKYNPETTGSKNLQEEVDEIDTELQQISEEIDSNTASEVKTVTEPKATSESNTASNEVAETEVVDEAVDEAELSDLEQEAMAMADDVNE